MTHAPPSFEALFRRAPGPVAVFDSSLAVVAANDSYRKAAGTAEALPADLVEAMRRVLATGEAVEGPVVPDGPRRWSTTSYPVPGGDGRAAFVVQEWADVTELATLRERDARRAEELDRARGDQRATAILESITDAFFSLDRQWRFTYLNAQSEPQLLRRRGELLGKVVWEEFPAAIGTRFEREYRRAMAERRPVTFEEFYPAPLDRWYEVNAYPTDEGLAVYFRNVTERKRAEEALREAERRSTAILECISDGFVAMDAEFRHTYINEAAERLTGLSRAELLGRTQWEVFPGSRGTQIEAAYRRAAAERVTVEFEAYHEPWGRWLAVKASPARDGGLSVYFQDVTERKRSEAALADARHRAEQQAREFDATLSAVRDYVFAIDRGGRFRYANRALLELWGLTDGEAIGKTLDDLGYPLDVKAQVLANCRKVFKSGRPVHDETGYQSPTGANSYHEYILAPVFDAAGTVVLVAGSSRDVTERRHSAAMLEEQKRVLELIAGGAALATVLDALCMMVEHHSGNRLLASILVLDPDGVHLRHGAAPSLPAAYNQAVDGIAIGPSVGSCGTAAYRREPVFVTDIAEDPLWADFKGLALGHELRACWSQPILSGQGEVLGTFAMYYPTPRQPEPGDLRLVEIITRTAAIAIGRDRAQSELRDARTRLESALSAGSIATWAWDLRRDRVVDDENLARLFSVTPEEAAGGPASCYLRAIHADDRDRVAAAIDAAVASGSHYESEFRVVLPGGDVRWVVARGQVVRDADGRPSGLPGVAVDITERKRFEEALREADRRKDEFLAMLAHELRNPLAAISNAVRLASRGGLPEHHDWSVDVITRQVKHLTHLIDDLLDVSRISRGKIALRRDVVELTPILESAASTVRTLVEERKHALELSIERGLLWANVDPTRLEQVVLNLLNNAAKYSDNGGRIRLSARNEGEEVVISVRDTGVGIPPEKLPQMFELFAQGDRTLARSEGGLGIGLTIVKLLVELHGGRVVAASEGPGRGSEFTIRLPRAEAPRPRHAASGGPSAPARAKARILVVDDNVDTARGMVRLLTLLGHDVAVAHSSPVAIEAARHGRPEFVLLDIGLPGMDGYEVAARLRREEGGRDAVLIAVSGYGQDDDRRRSRAAGFDHHLIKPLDHDALISLLAAGASGQP